MVTANHNNHQYIFPKDNKLSMEAKGLLSLMLNCVEYDYCSRESLYLASPNDSERTIDKAISELCKNEFVIEFQPDCFAVNKMKLPEMKIVK